MTESLGEMLPKEQARVRALLVDYKEIGAPGLIAATMMQLSLQNAENAVVSGDVARMIVAYRDLKEYQ